MSCEMFESLIALHVEGDLTAAEAEELAKHLRICAACRDFAEEMRASQRALKKHGRAAIEPAVLAGIRAGVLRKIERRRRGWLPVMQGIAAAVPRPRRFSPRALALAASLVLVLGAVVALLRWGEISRPEEPAWQSSEIEPVPPAARVEPIPAQAPSPVLPSAPERPPEPVPTSPPPAPGAERPGPGPQPVEELAATRIAAQQVPPAAPRPAAEPMMIKLVSDDLVIYWLVEPDPTQEETNHEVTTI